MSDNIIQQIHTDVRKLDEFLKSTNHDVEWDNDESGNSSSESEAENVGDSYDLSKFKFDEYLQFTTSKSYSDRIKHLTEKCSNVTETALVLNQLQQKILLNTIDQFELFLQNCRQRREQIKEELQKVESSLKSELHGKPYVLGAPFFKDSVMQPRFAPMNNDAIRKLRNHELLLSNLSSVRTWTQDDKQILLTDVINQLKRVKMNAIQEKIRLVSRQYIKAKSTEKKEEFKLAMNKLQQELASWQKKETIEFVDNENAIDWLKIAHVELKGRHTEIECKGMWYMYLHPDINKSSWSGRENKRLKELADKHRLQDWKTIALELGTKRSEYQCCVQYNLNLTTRYKNGKWTPEEDFYLLEIVKMCRIGNFIPWNKVAYYFKDRTRQQIYCRYNVSLFSEGKKGKFSEEEDERILELVKKHGTRFSFIARIIGNRCATQIRDRYNSVLKHKEIKICGMWTVEEDQLIVDHVKSYGSNHWNLLAETFKNRPIARTRVYLRHRWTVLKKFLEMQPGEPLENAPRRTRETKRKKESIKSEPVENEVTLIEVCKVEKDPLEVVEKRSFRNINRLGDTKIKLMIMKIFKKRVPLFYPTEAQIENLVFILFAMNAKVDQKQVAKNLSTLKKLTAKEFECVKNTVTKLNSKEILLKTYKKNSKNLVKYIPKGLLNKEDFIQTILFCKYMHRILLFTWAESELDNLCITSNKGYRRLRQNNNNTDIEIQDVMAEEYVLSLFTYLQNNKTIPDGKYKVHKKQESEKLLKRRLIGLFTLPPFVEHLLMIYESSGEFIRKGTSKKTTFIDLDSDDMEEINELNDSTFNQTVQIPTENLKQVKPYQMTKKCDESGQFNYVIAVNITEDDSQIIIEDVSDSEINNDNVEICQYIIDGDNCLKSQQVVENSDSLKNDLSLEYKNINDVIDTESNNTPVKKSQRLQIKRLKRMAQVKEVVEVKKRRKN